MKTTITVFILTITTLCYSGVSETINGFRQKTLVVITEVVNAKTYAKLDDQGKGMYNRAVENYNRKIKEVSSSYWTINKNILYKTWSEAKALLKTNSNEYLVFYAGNYSVDPTRYTYLMQEGLIFYPEIYSESLKRTYNVSVTSYKLCYGADLKKDKAIATRTIANLWPLKEDMIFAFQCIQSLLLESEKADASLTLSDVAARNHKLLFNSTLLIKDEWMKSRLVTEEVQAVYPFAFSIVNHDSLLSILETNGDYTYIEIVPEMIGTVEALRLGFEHILVNIKSGSIVSYITINWGILHATAGHGYHHKYVVPGIFSKYLETEPDAPDDNNEYDGNKKYLERE